jgi:glycosyltransferase involved in cell wall biosynthesis
VLPAVLDAKGDAEGQGVVVLEAMAFARPVLASRVGGIVDMVEDGNTGWLLPPGDARALADAVRQCSDNPDEARAKGEAGRRRLEAHFSLDVSAARLAALYRSLAARNHSSAQRSSA